MKRVRWKIASALVLALSVAVPAAVPAGAAASSTRVVPVGSSVLGKSYGEWSASWWQWVFGTPVTSGGPFDQGTVDCTANQPNPNVLFLTGPFNVSGTVKRTCAQPISASTYIFLPVINNECSNREEPSSGFFGQTPADRRTCAESLQFAELAASVDGRRITGLENFAVTSPDFTFKAVDGNPGGLAPGEGRSTSAGVWLMLQPLPLGQHRITFSGTYPAFDNFTLDVTYRITVA